MNVQLRQTYARQWGGSLEKARALGGEALGGEEPALNVMEREMKQARQSGAVGWSVTRFPVGPV